MRGAADECRRRGGDGEDRRRALGQQHQRVRLQRRERCEHRQQVTRRRLECECHGEVGNDQCEPAPGRSESHRQRESEESDRVM